MKPRRFIRYFSSDESLLTPPECLREIKDKTALLKRVGKEASIEKYRTNRGLTRIRYDGSSYRFLKKLGVY